MPFKSEAQRRFLYAKHPEIAKKWSGEMYGSPPKSGKGGTFANNTPVGSAGQPQGKMKAVAKSGAIERRIANMNKVKKGEK